MKTEEKRDSIDFELSRTYFSNFQNRPVERPEEPKPRFSIRKWLRRSLLKIVVVLLLLSFLVGAAYLLIQKRIIFSVNVNIEPATSTLSANIPSNDGPSKTENLKPILSEKHFPWISAPEYDLKNREVLYTFEYYDDGWHIPTWALDKPNYVGMFSRRVRGISSNGKGSIELYAEFPGKKWTAAILESENDLDLREYDILLADVYLPPNCEEGLTAKFILTIGENRRFVETVNGIKLEPGKWTTLIADLSEESIDWKRMTVDDQFKKDIRKVSIRFESNTTPAYSGPIYIDNIRVGLRKK